MEIKASYIYIFRCVVCYMYRSLHVSFPLAMTFNNRIIQTYFMPITPLVPIEMCSMDAFNVSADVILRISVFQDIRIEC